MDWGALAERLVSDLLAGTASAAAAAVTEAEARCA